MYLSDNSTEQIYYAKTFWVPIAVSAVVFLVVATYFGWQYQHRIRREYVYLVDNFDCVPILETGTESEMELKPVVDSKRVHVLVVDHNPPSTHAVEIVRKAENVRNETNSAEDRQ